MNKQYTKFRRYKTKKKVWEGTDWYCEPGDLMIQFCHLYRLRESNGWGKRSLGELTPIEIKPPKDGLEAQMIDGEVWWVEEVKPEFEVAKGVLAVWRGADRCLECDCGQRFSAEISGNTYCKKCNKLVAWLKKETPAEE